MSAVITLLAAAVLTAILTSLVRTLVLRRGWFDVPGERSMHRAPVPSGGGIAIAIVVIVGLLWTSDFSLEIMLVAMSLAVIGFIDDVSPLPILPRLLAQVIAVSVGLYSLGGAPELSFAGYAFSPIFANLLFGLACLWFLNLYNFMDGTDGLAASELVFVALAAAWLEGGTNHAPQWFVLAGAGVGFLVWNVPPARIFMGDAGSAFLGFVLAMLLVHAVSRNSFSLWAAIILVAPFVCDATVTLLRRFLRGELWYRPHMMHAYQCLARRWGSHGRVLIVLAAVNFGFVLPAAKIAEMEPAWAPFIAGLVFAVLSMLVYRSGAGRKVES